MFSYLARGTSASKKEKKFKREKPKSEIEEIYTKLSEEEKEYYLHDMKARILKKEHDFKD